MNIDHGKKTAPGIAIHTPAERDVQRMTEARARRAARRVSREPGPSTEMKHRKADSFKS